MEGLDFKELAKESIMKVTFVVIRSIGCLLLVVH